MRARLLVLAVLGCALAPPAARAACTNPPGTAGDQFYNNVVNAMQYCNGTAWINMGSTIGVSTLTPNDFCTTDGTNVFCTIGNPLPVGEGGTGDATLTAHGIVIGEGASNVDITGTGTQYQMLMSGGSSADPTWSTAIWPSGTTQYQILYSSAANTVTGLATADSSILATNSSGAPSLSSVLPSAVQGNITATGVLTSGSTGSGFTIALGTATVSGVLAVANGGTGAVTLTSNGILYGNGTSAVQITAAPSQYNVLTGNSSGVPVFGEVNLAQSAAVTGLLPLANGGTNADLTASNGGIFYSTGSAGAILSGTATADQILMSGSSTTPAWSTATYPASTTQYQILYSSATNTISGLATADNGILVTNGSGVPSIGTALPAQVQSNITGISASNITSGTLGVAYGGTGDNTLTANGVLYGNGTGAVSALTGTLGYILQFNGASSAPTAVSVLSSTILGNITSLSNLTSAASLAGVGTLTSGATGAGFTLNFGASTLSGALPVANGGTSNTTAQGARSSTGLNIDEMTTHGDSAYAIATTDRTVATSATLSAPRTWTLPLGSQVNAGQEVCIVDKAGGVSSTNDLTIAGAGSDTIQPSTATTIKTAYGSNCYASDGGSPAKWTSVGGGGGVPGGSTTDVQYNNNGALAGDSGFTYAGSNGNIYIAGDVGIGSTSPQWSLDVGSGGHIGWGPSYAIGMNSGVLALDAGPAFPSGYDLRTGSAAGMYISGGNVGIGTTAPEQTLTVAGNIDATGASGYITEIANDTSTGTTADKLAKLTTAGKAIVAGTTDSDGEIGIVIGGASTSGNAQIALAGQTSCVFDGATTAGDFVGISSTTAGDCHDTGSTSRPTTSETIGRVLSTNGSAGTYAVALGLGMSGSGGGVLIGTFTCANNPGTNYSVNFSGAANTMPSSGTCANVSLPSNTAYMIVELWGAGGAGGNSGGTSVNGANGNNGGTSCFGTNSTACTSSIISATGGVGGTGGQGNGSDQGEVGGAGGSGSGGDVNLGGNGGSDGEGPSTDGNYGRGGAGGNAPRGGGGSAGGSNSNGSTGNAYGGGGSGGGPEVAYGGGGGGGGGGYTEKLIGSPSGTYYYNIGTGGSQGSGGSTAGGIGGAGGITIRAYASSAVVGAITVGNGGTGNASLTSNVIYKGNGTSAMVPSSLTDTGSAVYTTENVGIGTTAPQNLLDVNGAASIGYNVAAPGSGLIVNGPAAFGTSAQTGSYEVTVNGSAFIDNTLDASILTVGGSTASATGSSIYSTNGNNMQFGIGGIAAMTISNGQQVGIGTTAPQNLLDVGSGAASTLTGNAISVSNTSGNSSVSVGQGIGNYGRLRWSYNATAASAYMALGVGSGTNPLVLQDAGGNVGIGTTAPQGQLHIDAQGSTLPLMITASSNAGIINVQNSSGALKFGLNLNSSGVPVFYDWVSGSALPSIALNSGNVGIGTTAPGATLDVQGTINTRTSGGIYGAQWTDSSGTFHLDGWTDLELDTGGTPHLFINGYNGFVGIGTTAPQRAFDVNGSIESYSGSDAILIAPPTIWANSSYSPGNPGSGWNALMTLTPGALGIGTTAPGAVLTVLANSPAATTTESSSGMFDITTGSNKQSLYMSYDGTNNIGFIEASETGYIVPLVLQPRGGYVGIGTTWPVYPLDVNGNLNVRSGSYYLYAGSELAWAQPSSGDFYFGLNAGNTSATGSGNTALGLDALTDLSSGNYNTAVGGAALDTATSSYGNTAVGYGALLAVTTSSGYYNTALGMESGYNVTGAYNILIGVGGYVNGSGTGGITSGSNNIVIGENLTLPTPANSNQLDIGNLIFATGLASGGTLSSGYVGIANTSPSYVLDVTGEARFTGGYTTSDRRWKKDIAPIKDGLAIVDRLQGVTFDWRRREFPKMHFAEGRQFGFIAQEVQKVVPEAVSTDKEGYENVSYQSFIPILAEAVKQLKADNGNLRAELKATNDDLRTELKAANDNQAADGKAIAELRGEVAALKKEIHAQ